jgi:hypothetical protein
MSNKTIMPTIKSTRVESSGIYKDGIFYSIAEILHNKREQANISCNNYINLQQQPNYVKYIAHGYNYRQFIPAGAPFW